MRTTFKFDILTRTPVQTTAHWWWAAAGQSCSLLALVGVCHGPCVTRVTELFSKLSLLTRVFMHINKTFASEPCVPMLTLLCGCLLLVVAQLWIVLQELLQRE